MRTSSAVLALALWASSLGAQVLQPRQPSWTDKWNFGVGLFGGLPVGDFRQHENGGGGVDIMLGFQPFRRQPLSIRGNAVFTEYGQKKERGFQQVCDDFGTCSVEVVDFDARNHNMFMFQGGTEIMATDGKWRPFAFALAGVTVFSSTATLTADDPSGPDQTSESLFSSNNFSTSYGVGLRRVGTRWGRETGFELSTRLTRNGKATYLTEDGVFERPDGTFDISPRRGAANVVGIQLGFWIGPYINYNERR